MRQRTVSDFFWEDPDLAHLTSENRLTLLMLLTNGSSNIVGVYRVVWRVLGSGVGWTHEQTLQAAKDLQEKGVAEVDEATGWVWVKVWWKNNSLKGAFTGNVSKKAIIESRQVPEIWKERFIQWLFENDPEGATKGLVSSLVGAGGNPNPNLNSIRTTTRLASLDNSSLNGVIFPHENNEPTAPDDAGGGPVIDVFMGAAGNPQILFCKRKTLEKKLGAATEEQSLWAGVAWRETVDGGKAESPEGLAVTLCLLAAKGGMTRPKTRAELESSHSSDERTNGWERLKSLSGRKYLTPDGLASVNPGGTISLPCGSISGSAALQALVQIESGIWPLA